MTGGAERPVWVVRNDTISRDALLEEGMVTIGWDVGEVMGFDYSAVKEAVVRAFPDYTNHKAGNVAGQLWLVATRMTEGDIVVAPVRKQQMVDIGVVAGPAFHSGDAVHPLRRPVRWVELGLSRLTDLSESSRAGLKSQLTAYTHHSGDEFREIVAAREAVDADQVRRLVGALIPRVDALGVDSSSYAAIRDGGDPVLMIRHLIDQGFASPIFQQLHAAGRADLTLEALVVANPAASGATPAIARRARERLEFYGT